MPHPQFERFRGVVDADAALRAELWAITDATQFVATVVRRAAERDITLVDGDVWEAFAAGRSALLAAQMP